MYMHHYEGTAHAFQKCVELNNWSHALYWYIAGAAYVELYRRNKLTDPEAATKYAAEAKEFFQKVLPNIGKKRFMGRQLPFDIFVNRKLQKWEARAKDWNCDMIDAVGVSPLEEMIYFWNGTKRMQVRHLETSLENLAWSESAANPHWEKETLDEKAILHILRASALRNMNRTTEAKAILEKEIIPVDKMLFKGGLKDNWTAPCARYEMAANLWREADVDGRPGQHMDTLNKCRDWLQEVTAWDGFDLDARYVPISVPILFTVFLAEHLLTRLLQNRNENHDWQGYAKEIWCTVLIAQNSFEITSALGGIDMVWIHSASFASHIRTNFYTLLHESSHPHPQPNIYIGSSLGSIITSLTATCSGCFSANTIAPATSSASNTFAPLGSPNFFNAS
jgi:hypothetical protein